MRANASDVQLLDAHGNPIERDERKPARRSLAAQRPRPLPARAPGGSQFAFRDTLDRRLVDRGSLTIERIATCLRHAEQGWPEEMVDLFESRIEADAHLRAAFDNRNESVSQKPWTIVEGGDTQADKDAARELERRLRLVPNFVDTLSWQLTFVPFGWGASEIDWRIVEGMVAPAWFANVPHRRFRFDRETDRLQIVTEEANVDGEPLRAGKWWVSCRSRGRLLATAGLMRTAVWWSTFKTLSTRDWLILSDRFGIPFVTGEYDESIGPDDKDALRDAVQALGTDGWAIFSDAAKIQLHEISNGNVSNAAEGIHGALINLCDTQMSKLIEGATLVSEVDGPGSHALGTVHENRYHSILEGDAEKLSESFENQVGLPFVRYNGLSARPPRLKVHLGLNLTVSEQIKMALELANGLENFELDEEQIRQMTLLKRPTSSANALKGIDAVAALAPTPAPGGTNEDDAD